VGFRWFVQELAALGMRLAGCRTGPMARSSLIQAEAEAVERIDRHIRRGPPAAVVDDVQTADEPALDSLRSFSIRG
jgi:acylphosphatase